MFRNKFFRNKGPKKLPRGFEPHLEPTMSPITAAFFGLIVVFVLYQIVGSFIALAIFGMDIQNADVNLIRLFSIGGEILLILFPALLFAKLIFEDVSTVIRFKPAHIKEIGIFVIGLILIVPLLQNYLYIQNYFFEHLAASSETFNALKGLLDELDKYIQETYGNLLSADTVFGMSFVVVVVAVTPAVCEEVFFRGYVQKSFEQRLQPFTAALVTGVFFGLYHFNPYGLIALIFLGTYIGYAAYMTNSIFVPILLHFLNNFVSIAAYYIFDNKEFLESKVNDPQNFNAHLGNFVFLLILFSAFIIFVRSYYNRKNS
jgi:hypothetical protein